jgi:hypothetical protein
MSYSGLDRHDNRLKSKTEKAIYLARNINGEHLFVPVRLLAQMSSMYCKGKRLVYSIVLLVGSKASQ